MPDQPSIIDMMKKHSPSGYQKMVDAGGKFADFDVPSADGRTKKIDLTDYIDFQKTPDGDSLLKNGSYTALRTVPGLEEGMKYLGADVIGMLAMMNKKAGTNVRLEDTKEFSGLDILTDGKPDPLKVGVVLLATSMTNTMPPSKKGTVLTSEFDNNLSLGEIADLGKAPEKMLTNAMAEEILKDMKLKHDKLAYKDFDANTPETNQPFMDTVKVVHAMASKPRNDGNQR